MFRKNYKLPSFTFFGVKRHIAINESSGCTKASTNFTSYYCAHTSKLNKYEYVDLTLSTYEEIITYHYSKINRFTNNVIDNYGAV